MPADAAPGRARPLGGESEALEQPVPRDSRSSEGPKAAIRGRQFYRIPRDSTRPPPGGADSLGNETLVLTTLHVFAFLSLILGEQRNRRNRISSLLFRRPCAGDAGRGSHPLGGEQPRVCGKRPLPFITVTDLKRKKQRSFIRGYFSCETPRVSCHSEAVRGRPPSRVSRALGHSLFRHLESPNL